MWEAKPLYYDAMVIGNNVYAVKDGLGTGTQIGVIISSHSVSNAMFKMRYIRVEGTNNTIYHGRYCEAKGNIVSLKRTAVKEAHRQSRSLARSLARIKKFNFGKRCEKTPT